MGEMGVVSTADELGSAMLKSGQFRCEVLGSSHLLRSCLGEGGTRLWGFETLGLGHLPLAGQRSDLTSRHVSTGGVD